MYDVFRGTKSFLVRKPKIEAPRPDNIVFRLHYQYTFSFLSIAVLLVTGYSYIDSSGSAIQCMLDGGVKVSGSIINSYCWIMSTYSLPRHWNGTVGTDFLHHGVGPQKEEDETVYHAYYQWVPLFLSFQAVMFYFPHYVWKCLEGGRFRKIMAGLNASMYANREMDLKNLTNYLVQRMGPGMQSEHRFWALKFYFCEILNFINVIVQIAVTDSFLGGAFSKFGLEAATWSDTDGEERVDPMYRVFPRMTKCMFQKFGPSGTIEKLDALCVLGMNIINEKIFVFLWFWYVILAVITALNLIVRGVELMMPKVRMQMIKLEEFGLRDKKISSEALANVLDSLSYSDWLLVYYLSQCMDKTSFSQLVLMLEESITVMDDEVDKAKMGRDLDKEEMDTMGRNSTLRSPHSLKNFIPTKKD